MVKRAKGEKEENLSASKTHNGPFLFVLGLTDAKYFWSGCVASCGLRRTSSRVSKPLKDMQGEITSSQLKGCLNVFVHLFIDHPWQ